MLERMLWESRPCNICITQIRELSELQARIEHVKALGKRSHEATVEQDRVNNEIDDHIHNALVLVTPARDKAENFSAKISEDVENVRVALRRAVVTPSSEPNGSEA
ncbi:hypothetical protein V3C99_001430 [Haemonchus contortus]